MSRPRGDGSRCSSLRIGRRTDRQRRTVLPPVCVFVAISRQKTLRCSAADDVRFDWELAQWGLVMRKLFPGGHLGPNCYPHCKVSDSGHLCFWDTKLAMWVPMFRLTNAQMFEWMKSIKVLDAELR